MGYLEALRGNTNGAKHTCNVTSHVGTPRNVSGENMTRLGEFKKMSQKHPKLKVIIHDFGFSPDPRFERHGMPPRDIGGRWKGVMWLGRNIWMPSSSFRTFEFHEK